jgi:hypothetical protein
MSCRRSTGASKMVFEPMVRSSQTVLLSCVKISTISKCTETSFQLTIVTLVYHQVRAKRFLSLWYVWRKPCTYLAPTLPLSPNKIPDDPRHLGVLLGASKTISEPMVRSAQTVHPSCMKIVTIFKQTKTSFHLSLVTSEYLECVQNNF